MSEMVVMGRIAAPYGIQGWLKVQPYTEIFDGLSDYPDWWLGREDGFEKNAWQKYRVETVKIHAKSLLVKLQGVDDRDAALAVKGKHIAVPREQLPKAKKGEYYWSDLIGIKVANQDQVDFGTVAEVIETGANDVLVVKQAEKERLIPFISQVVLKVDIESKTMLVDWDAEF